jgi:Carboxypeptidase regulatory-like domain
MKLCVITLLLLTAVVAAAQSNQSTDTDDRTNVSKTGSINGRVVTESGEPLVDAFVSLRSYTSRDSYNAITDRDGKFRFRGLSPIVYLASASSPAYTAAPRDPDSTQSTSYRIGDVINLVMIKGGVITGTVTNSTGDPVVGVRVRAQMIRDGDGQRSRYGALMRERTTDDRGNYRIYGLPTGSYLVFAGGGVGAYEGDAPTYAPSSVRDTALEIIVRAGEETTGVDIRYRSETGHSVSGSVGSTGPDAYGVSIILTSTLEGGSQASESYYQQPGTGGFWFTGVADGDYDLTAQSYAPSGDIGVSEPKRIRVRGADISGVDLVTNALGTITGRVMLEESKAAECKGKRRVLPTEILVSAWHNESEARQDKPQFIWGLGGPTFPNQQGDISLRNLASGQYQLVARQFAKYWYLKSISLPAPTTATSRQIDRTQDAVQNWITLRRGDHLSGLVVTIAEGAASLRAQMTVEEGTSMPQRLYVYLVPAEREKALDPLRYLAAPVAADRTMSLNNIPPGRYLMVLQPPLDKVRPTLSKLRLPDEAETRARLRRDAEAATIEIGFRPCENVMGYQLPYKVSGSASNPLVSPKP